MFHLAIVLSVSMFYLQTLYGKPNYIKTCKLTDPNLNECAKENAAAAISLLTSDTSLGIPILDPWFIPEFKLEAPETGPFKAQTAYKNLNFHGFQNMKFTEFIIDPVSLNMKFEFDIKTFIEGDCGLDGEIVGKVVSGSSKSHFTIDNMHIIVEMPVVEIYEKNGKKYLETDFLIDVVTWTNPVIQFNDLNGNDAFSSEINALISENIDQIFPVLKMQFSKGFELTLRQVINQIFANIPLDEMYPDDKDRFL